MAACKDAKAGPRQTHQQGEWERRQLPAPGQLRWPLVAETQRAPFLCQLKALLHLRFSPLTRLRGRQSHNVLNNATGQHSQACLNRNIETRVWRIAFYSTYMLQAIKLPGRTQQLKSGQNLPSALTTCSPSEPAALWLLEGAPKKLDLNLSTGGLRLDLPPLSNDMAGPEAAGSCLGKAVSTLMEGAAHARKYQMCLCVQLWASAQRACCCFCSSCL